MSPIYNLSYTNGLALSRMRIDAEGVIVEADGYDRDLRKWTYHYLFAAFGLGIYSDKAR